MIHVTTRELHGGMCLAALPQHSIALSDSKPQAPMATTPTAVASAATVTGGQAIRPQQVGTFIFLNFFVFGFNEFFGAPLLFLWAAPSKSQQSVMYENTRCLMVGGEFGSIAKT